MFLIAVSFSVTFGKASYFIKSAKIYQNFVILRKERVIWHLKRNTTLYFPIFWNADKQNYYFISTHQEVAVLIKKVCTVNIHYASNSVFLLCLALFLVLSNTFKQFGVIRIFQSLIFISTNFSLWLQCLISCFKKPQNFLNEMWKKWSLCRWKYGIVLWRKKKVEENNLQRNCLLQLSFSSK